MSIRAFLLSVTRSLPDAGRGPILNRSALAGLSEREGDAPDGGANQHRRKNVQRQYDLLLGGIKGVRVALGTCTALASGRKGRFRAPLCQKASGRFLIGSLKRPPSGATVAASSM